MIIPESEIRLLKCPIEEDSINQLTFNSVDSQTNYFLSLPYVSLENATYLRKDKVIRFDKNYDSLLNFNYVMYKNKNYSNKWFYAFITDIEYINDSTTYISIKTDVFQTWQFDLIYKRCFVEREHVNDDTIGLHTIPEELEHGEYVINNLIYDEFNVDTPDSEKSVYIISSSLKLDEEINPVEEKYPYLAGALYNGTMSGNVYWGAHYTGNFALKMFQINTSGQIDAVNGVFIAPKWLVGSFSGGGSYGMVSNTSNVASRNISINKNNQLGNEQFGLYTPKNNKLLTEEYNYLLISNGGGNSAKFNFEDFSGNNVNFEMSGVLTPGCSIKLTPSNYMIDTNTDNHSLMLGKYPILNWNADMYNTWFKQNGLNFAFDILGSGLRDIVNFGNFGIGLSGTVSSVLDMQRQKYQHSFDAPQNRGNVNSGDVSYSKGFNRFQFYTMTIKPEYAKIIDNFFSCYGYKVNDVKIPNVNGRRNWNYVKLISPIIEGEVPQSDLQEIKNLFSNGITLWHNPNTFLDYSQNNDIIQL